MKLSGHARTNARRSGTVLLALGAALSAAGVVVERGADAEGRILLALTYLTWVATAGCALALWQPGGRRTGVSDAAQQRWTTALRMSAYALLAAVGVQFYGRINHVALSPVEAPGAYLLLLGCAVSVPAGVALLVLPARPGEVALKGRPWRRGAALGCVLALAAGTGAVALAQWTSEVEYAHASEPAPGAKVPSALGEDLWTWDPPENTEIEEVRPAPTGPLVVLADGAVMLNPRTGKERWHFRVSPEALLDFDAATTEFLNAGRSVRMHFSTEALGSVREREVVLDTATGATGLFPDEGVGRPGASVRR